jgi:hypothetical protein
MTAWPKTLQWVQGPADVSAMNCTRCGVADASISKDDGSYCAGCASIRDWQELIALVQDALVTTPVAGDGRVLRSA